MLKGRFPQDTRKPCMHGKHFLNSNRIWSKKGMSSNLSLHYMFHLKRIISLHANYTYIDYSCNHSHTQTLRHSLSGIQLWIILTSSLRLYTPSDTILCNCKSAYMWNTWFGCSPHTEQTCMPRTCHRVRLYNKKWYSISTFSCMPQIVLYEITLVHVLHTSR